MQQQRCIPSIGSVGGCNNNNNSNSGGGGCIVGVNNMGNCYYATAAPTMKTAANLLPFSSSASNGPLPPPPPPLQQQPAISPTFIEHKYSANTFKEKFLANIRQNQQNVTNKLKSLHSSSSPTAIMMDTPNSRTLTDNDGSINNCETSNVIIKNSLETDVIDDDDVDDDDDDDNNNNNNNDDDDGGKGTNVGGNGDVCGVASIFATDDGDDDVNNGNPEKCSIQQQLNETMKNNLYKKSIN